ncbi:response regulator transcription factor [Novosphingobium flavum]|uniref:Response regulator transcription factor n=1 Tax=Novosphingobium flavum TaxID=1778672 RepID=A0A7X1KL41_9SPHN|nr:response regulator transcription factor [Novosphingobium flavum]MBC2665201.1 response regulator transcription factor [Novosphingobium flavum]
MKILLAEDDPELAEALVRLFQREGLTIDVARNGEDAVHLGRSEAYDCAVLDLGLPRLDGLEVLREWRRAGLSCPTLILTARDGWSDKEAGFTAGADDYLTKPFLAKELLLRLKALVRRSRGPADRVIRCGRLSQDILSGAFYMGEDILSLTAFETRLLEKLLHNKEIVVQRSSLSDYLYGYADDVESNSLDVIIGRLRRKIGREMIETVRGLGYRLTARQG